MRRSTISRRQALTGLAALAASIGLAPARAQAARQPIRFILDWRFEGPAALVLLAQHRKYFEQEGLDVSVDTGPGSAGTVARVASGAYEMGAADVAAMVEFIANNPTNPGARMQAVYMLYDYTAATVFSLKKTGIVKPSDLHGKRMGAPVFDAGRKTFPLFVKANNLDAGKITWTSMEPALRETLLARGDVDAITAFSFTSPLNLNALGVPDDQIASMRYPDYGVKLYGNAIFVSQAFAERNPNAVSAFLRALNRSVKETLANPDAAIESVRARDPLIDVAKETRRLKICLDGYVRTPDFRTHGLGGIDTRRFADTVAQVAEAFQLKSPPQAEALFNAAFLPPRSDRQMS